MGATTVKEQTVNFSFALFVHCTTIAWCTCMVVCIFVSSGSGKHASVWTCVWLVVPGHTHVCSACWTGLHQQFLQWFSEIMFYDDDNNSDNCLIDCFSISFFCVCLPAWPKTDRCFRRFLSNCVAYFFPSPKWPILCRVGRLTLLTHSLFSVNLRMSVLALCYSAAEYCAPFWARSPYTKLIDVQLNESMRIVSGALLPTPLPWLPVLSHTTPPHIRRMAATNQLLSKIRFSDFTLSLILDMESNLEFALHQDVQYGSRNYDRKKCHHDRNGLKSGLL